jgi:hypothetical protein
MDHLDPAVPVKAVPVKAVPVKAVPVKVVPVALAVQVASVQADPVDPVGRAAGVAPARSSRLSMPIAMA